MAQEEEEEVEVVVVVVVVEPSMAQALAPLAASVAPRRVAAVPPLRRLANPSAQLGPALQRLRTPGIRRATRR